MKPTHGFKNLQIGFGKEMGGWVGANGQERSFRGVKVSITAKDRSLLSNEHESWSISQLKRQQTVMETQQRMGRQRCLT